MVGDLLSSLFAAAEVDVRGLQQRDRNLYVLFKFLAEDYQVVLALAQTAPDLGELACAGFESLKYWSQPRQRGLRHLKNIPNTLENRFTEFVVHCSKANRHVCEGLDKLTDEFNQIIQPSIVLSCNPRDLSN